jgi:FkbM family methyltransferase
MIMENLMKLYCRHFGNYPKNILEIGSRDGHDAELLRKIAMLTPDKVFCVEPHPVSASLIRQNYPGFRVIEAAVTDVPGIVRFNAIPYSYPAGIIGQSSLLARPNDPTNSNWIHVIGITAYDLFTLTEQDAFDLVKIDVEGFSFNVLNSFVLKVRRVKMIHVEVETDPIWKDQMLDEDVLRFFEAWGFEKVYEVPAWPGQVDQVWKRI